MLTAYRCCPQHCPSRRTVQIYARSTREPLPTQTVAFLRPQILQTGQTNAKNCAPREDEPPLSQTHALAWDATIPRKPLLHSSLPHAENLTLDSGVALCNDNDFDISVDLPYLMDHSGAMISVVCGGEGGTPISGQTFVDEDGGYNLIVGYASPHDPAHVGQSGRPRCQMRR